MNLFNRKPARPQIRTSKFADFVLFYKGRDGEVKQKEYNDTEASNVYRVARTLPQGTVWRIKQLSTKRAV